MPPTSPLQSKQLNIIFWRFDWMQIGTQDLFWEKGNHLQLNAQLNWNPLWFGIKISQLNCWDKGNAKNSSLALLSFSVEEFEKARSLYIVNTEANAHFPLALHFALCIVGPFPWVPIFAPNQPVPRLLSVCHAIPNPMPIRYYANPRVQRRRARRTREQISLSLLGSRPKGLPRPLLLSRVTLNPVV